MTPASIDEGNYDVQFSIRVPKSLADEINTRAEREGIKPSTWIRNAIAYTIEDKDKTRAEDIRIPLLRILQQDETVRNLIREITRAEQTPARSIETVKEELAETQRRNRKCEQALHDSQQTTRLIERQLAEQERALNHLDVQQKKLLSAFLQDPNNRETLTRLDEVAARLTAEKEKYQALSVQLTAAREETIKYEAKFLETNTAYMKLREELAAQSNSELRERFNRINKRMGEKMK